MFHLKDATITPPPRYRSVDGSTYSSHIWKKTRLGYPFLPLRDITQSWCHTKIEGLLLTRLQLQQWSLSWWRVFFRYFAVVFFILGWRCANIFLKNLVSPMENGELQIVRDTMNWFLNGLDESSQTCVSKSHELRCTPPANCNEFF